MGINLAYKLLGNAIRLFHYSARFFFYWSTMCCIRCGPGEERILDIVPGGTELGTQVKTGNRAGRTHSHQSPGRVYWSFIVRN